MNNSGDAGLVPVRLPALCNCNINASRELQVAAASLARATSQVMIDKAAAVPREKVGRVFGRLDDESLKAVDRTLAVFLGLAG